MDGTPYTDPAKQAPQPVSTGVTMPESPLSFQQRRANPPRIPQAWLTHCRLTLFFSDIFSYTPPSARVCRLAVVLSALLDDIPACAFTL
jgi:hypothetical protein